VCSISNSLIILVKRGLLGVISDASATPSGIKRAWYACIFNSVLTCGGLVGQNKRMATVPFFYRHRKGDLRVRSKHI
jgi:hypothetical protein